MTFQFDGSPEVRDQVCPSCDRPYRWVTGLIQRDGDAFAVYYAQCHGHGDASEAWVDVVVGSWDEPEYSDHATFSCRVSYAGAGAVDAPVASRARHRSRVCCSRVRRRWRTRASWMCGRSLTSS